MKPLTVFVFLVGLLMMQSCTEHTVRTTIAIKNLTISKVELMFKGASNGDDDTTIALLPNQIFEREQGFEAPPLPLETNYDTCWIVFDDTLRLIHHKHLGEPKNILNTNTYVVLNTEEDKNITRVYARFDITQDDYDLAEPF